MILNRYRLLRRNLKIIEIKYSQKILNYLFVDENMLCKDKQSLKLSQKI